MARAMDKWRVTTEEETRLEKKSYIQGRRSVVILSFALWSMIDFCCQLTFYMVLCLALVFFFLDDTIIDKAFNFMSLWQKLFKTAHNGCWLEQKTLHWHRHQLLHICNSLYTATMMKWLTDWLSRAAWREIWVWPIFFTRKNKCANTSYPAI